MKNYLLVLLSALFSTISNGQQITPAVTGTNKISGKVADAGNGQALEYATITLINTVTKKIINGSVTDKKGVFTIQKIKEGTYTIDVEFLGYKKFVKEDIVVKDEAAAIILPTVLLEKKAEALSGITVTSKAKVIESKIDKIVYNVDKDVTSQGGVATDALKKIPGVTVDVDGNVELLGNSSIRFLIDGKPSSLFGNSVADALQSIPNSQIQNIEVITSPSAKYDASGTGGIINIILKKNKVQGFNGNINLAAGTRLENGSINIGYKKNNIGLNAFYSGNAQLKAVTPTGMDRIASNHFNNSKSELQQTSDGNFNRNSYNGGMGVDWAISKQDNLTATIAIHHLANRNEGNTNQFFLQFDSSGNKLSATNSLRIYDNQFDVNTFDNSISYKRKFKKENQELEISYSGSYGRNNTFYNQTQQYSSNTSPFSGSNSLNPGKENETELAVDYVHPVTKDFLLEAGFKNIFQSIISNADVFALVPYSSNYIKDEKQSYASDYRRTIYAGYATATFSLFKYLDVKVGLRYEYTISKANYSNANDVAIPDYTNLAPSFVMSHSFANNQTLKFSYSYRLERPDYRDLNPFLNLSDPHNITTGNPRLQPEIGHNWQLGYNRSFESGTNINVLLYTERNYPDIKPYIIYYPLYKIGDSSYTDVSITTRANIAHEIKTGVNISVAVPVGKKLNIRSNAMLFKRSFENIYVTPSKTSTTGYRLNLNLSYQFNKVFVGEIFGNYNSGMQWQGKQPSVFSYTMAFRKQFLKNKASMGIVAVNAFNKYIVQKSFLTAQDIIINSYRNIPYRSFGISFTYKFGKLKFAKQKEGDNYLYSTPPVEN